MTTESFSFFHNREYFDGIADGYTLFGNQISGKIRYQPAAKVLFELGGLMSKDFGNKKFTIIQPIYTVRIMGDSSEFNFGNIRANLAHKLLEPMYQFENAISQPLESGIQYISYKNNRQIDFWADWQNMIYRNTSDQEQIWGGLTLKQKIYQLKSLKIELPLQFTAMHIGGQIDSSHAPVTTNLNLASGLEFTYNSSQLRRLHFNSYLLLQKNDFKSTFLPKTGNGLYLNLISETKNITTALSYWYSKNYVSSSGADIYQIYNKYDGSAIAQERNLLIFKIIYTKKIIDNMYLTARFEPYYNINLKTIDHAEGLFINYKQNFKLK